MYVSKTTLWLILLFFFVGKLNCTAPPIFFAYVQPNMKGELNCFEIENGRNEVNFPNTTSLTIQSCRLLKTTLIHQLINNLGIERLTRLEFNFKNNNEIALSYYTFNEFNLEEFISDHVQYVQKIKNSSEIDVNEGTLSIESLQSRDKLQVLRLSGGLTALSENMLSNLTNLKRLYLQNNELDIIPSAVVKNLENLEIIDLNHNKIKNLTVHQFPNLKKLKYVNLSSNEISIIFFNAFEDNRKVEVFDLQNNPIVRLPHSLFSRFSKLVEVNLRNCKLTNIPKSLFFQSKSMKIIDLSFNEIKCLDETLFHSLKELRHLDISLNKLSDLPEHVFSNLEKLKYLNLSSNNLTNLENIDMKSLVSLVELDLQYNQLTSILVDFRFAQHLNYINLSHNNLEEMVLNSSSLKKIDVSHNELTIIGQWIFQIKDLMYLDASFNKISHLDIDFFVQFANFSTLNLSNNRIATIEFYNLERLEQGQYLDNLVIKLNKNSIQCDCLLTSFVQYLQLEESLNPINQKRVIIESDDLVCETPKNLKNELVVNLNSSTLTCSYDSFYANNCSDVCDCYVRVWDDAIIVDCENKNLTEVPILNLPQSNIVEVNLQNNFLISGPHDLMGYENVTKLLLSNNSINDLSWTPPRLKTLTLDGNNFTVFNCKMWKLLKSPNLSNVSLGDNPWICNCSAKILHKYLSEYKTSKLIDDESIICTGNGSKIIDLNVDHLCELYYLDTIDIYLIALVSIIIMSILSVLTVVTVLLFKISQKRDNPRRISIYLLELDKMIV